MNPQIPSAEDWKQAINHLDRSVQGLKNSQTFLETVIILGDILGHYRKVGIECGLDMGVLFSEVFDPCSLDAKGAREILRKLGVAKLAPRSMPIKSKWGSIRDKVIEYGKLHAEFTPDDIYLFLDKKNSRDTIKANLYSLATRRKNKILKRTPGQRGRGSSKPSTYSLIGR